MDFSWIQPWDLQIVEWIQGFRTDFLDSFFLLITQLGDETIFLVVAASLYWLVDKKFAYRFMMFFLYSAVLNASLKLSFSRPRPHTLPTVTSVGEPSIGTSFPSGHAMNSTVTAWVIHEKNKPYQSVLTWLLTVMVGLVLLSRLYLGQHYLSDVIVGAIVASLFYALIIAMVPYFFRMKHWIIACSLPCLFLLLFWLHDEVLTIASSAIIFINLGVFLEQRWIRFTTKASLKGLALRLLLGLAGAFLLKEGLKFVFPYSDLLEPSTMDLWLDFVRYGMICLWMSLGAPSLFKYLT